MGKLKCKSCGKNNSTEQNGEIICKSCGVVQGYAEITRNPPYDTTTITSNKMSPFIGTLIPKSGKNSALRLNRINNRHNPLEPHTEKKVLYRVRQIVENLNIPKSLHEHIFYKCKSLRASHPNLVRGRSIETFTIVVVLYVCREFGHPTGLRQLAKKMGKNGTRPYFKLMRKMDECGIHMPPPLSPDKIISFMCNVMKLSETVKRKAISIIPTKHTDGKSPYIMAAVCIYIAADFKIKQHEFEKPFNISSVSMRNQIRAFFPEHINQAKINRWKQKRKLESNK